MMTIVRFGEQMIVKAMSILVFPFVVALMMLALYLFHSGAPAHWIPSL
jgi:serine transporter